MPNFKQYNINKPEVETIKIFMLNNYLKDLVDTDQINLDPDYQRDLVWEIEDILFFIHSVFNNMSPSNILMNKEISTEKTVYTAMDGKQRIHALSGFFDGIYPLLIETTNSEVQLLYFIEKYKISDAIKEYVIKNFNDKFIDRSMNNNERENLKNKMVVQTIYTNLSYNEQVEIFSRIHHGKSMSSGERLIGSIKSKKVRETFNELINIANHKFITYHGFSNDRRKTAFTLAILLRITFDPNYLNNGNLGITELINYFKSTKKNNDILLFNINTFMNAFVQFGDLYNDVEKENNKNLKFTGYSLEAFISEYVIKEMYKTVTTKLRLKFYLESYARKISEEKEKAEQSKKEGMKNVFSVNNKSCISIMKQHARNALDIQLKIKIIKVKKSNIKNKKRKI